MTPKCDLCGGELKPGKTTLEIWRDAGPDPPHGRLRRGAGLLRFQTTGPGRETVGVGKELGSGRGFVRVISKRVRGIG